MSVESRNHLLTFVFSSLTSACNLGPDTKHEDEISGSEFFHNESGLIGSNTINTIK